MRKTKIILIIIALAILAMVVKKGIIQSKEPRSVITQPKIEQKVKEVTAQELGELFCISHAVYHEARGESLKGQIAVAWVIKNRMGSGVYPNDACDVVYQKFQFSYIKSTDPKINSQAWEDAVEVARLVYRGKVLDPTKGARYYYAPKKLDKTPRWALNKKTPIQIGNHLFFNL